MRYWRTEATKADNPICDLMLEWRCDVETANPLTSQAAIEPLLETAKIEFPIPGCFGRNAFPEHHAARIPMERRLERQTGMQIA